MVSSGPSFKKVLGLFDFNDKPSDYDLGFESWEEFYEYLDLALSAKQINIET